jgi:Flp pilus assembly protein TadD
MFPVKSLHRTLGFSILIAAGVVALSAPTFAQRPGGGATQTQQRGSNTPGDLGVSSTGSLTVYVREPSGAPIAQMAIVTVTMMTQQYYRQLTTQGGSASFGDVLAGKYNVQAIAPGYEKVEQEVELTGMNTLASIDIVLQPLRDSAAGAIIPGPPVLAPKVQKQLGEALQALRAGKPDAARSHLEKALQLAPSHPEVNYLYGVYWAQSGNWASAKASWAKAVEIYPQHAGANLSLGEALFRDGKYADALKNLSRAIQSDPSSWRAHLLLANSSLRLNAYSDAETHSRRALELGHSQAASAHFVLAEVYHQRGDTGSAISELRSYLLARPNDPSALRAIDRLTAPTPIPAAEIVPALPVAPASEMIPSATKWLPPNVDDFVPPVEPGVACPLPDVLEQVSLRVSQFLRDVDRFTATESLRHETINNWGVVSSTENRRFDYLVSYREMRPHYFAVEEYRNGSLDLSIFPEGIATVGLPSLLLVFEKAQRENYDIACEGLTRFRGGLAWQLHFVQRTDKPRQLRSYRLGPRSYPIAVKGRAWVASDSFQILRMETDLLSAPPEIRLIAEHIDLEYGPVYFNGQKDPLWVPQNADIHLDWQGHKIHRKHSFDNFLLFGVHEKMKISPPKEVPAETEASPADKNKPST